MIASQGHAVAGFVVLSTPQQDVAMVAHKTKSCAIAIVFVGARDRARVCNTRAAVRG